MKRSLVTALSIAVLAGGAAWAGINPSDPGLPHVTDTAQFGTGADIVRNQKSAMCVDCHTAIPKNGVGSHFVTLQNSLLPTNSGGSGIGATGTKGAARDDGEYFKTGVWTTTTSAGISKYATAAGASIVSALPTGRTLPMTAAVQAIPVTADIICESCHSITNNEQGGNNLLELQTNGTVINWQQGATADLCVGCHGFMYTTGEASNSGSTNYGTTGVNAKDIGTAGNRGNNEYHFINGTAYNQNHHVMTGDVINATRAAAGILWTDNTVISYSETALDNVSTKGTYNVSAAWTGSVTKPTTAANLSCTNCHAPGHGGDPTEGASILRGTALAGGRTALQRNSDVAHWKTFADLNFCGQCHK